MPQLGLVRAITPFKVIEGNDFGTNQKLICDFLSHVAQSCYSVIGDKPFLWSKAKFDPP